MPFSLFLPSCVKTGLRLWSVEAPAFPSTLWHLLCFVNECLMNANQGFNYNNFIFNVCVADEKANIMGPVTKDMNNFLRSLSN